jgi:hypothetical protein
VKRLLASLLLVGALLGLFGAQLAYAHGVPTVVSAPQVTAMDADCMAMMAKQQPTPKGTPCKGLTLDCIGAMGCVVPIVLGNAAPSPMSPWFHDQATFWTTVSVLHGHEYAPEPEPPTLLG